MSQAESRFNLSVTRGTSERYALRYNGGWGWAIVHLNDSNGDIAIQSDYGNFGYVWRHRGEDVSLKEFLVSTNRDYVLRKFGADSGGKSAVFDFYTTCDRIRREILAVRRSGEIDAEFARELMNELQDLNDTTSQESFLGELMSKSAFITFYPDYDIPLVTDYKPGLIAFMDEVWPELIKIWKEELDASKTEVVPVV